MAKRQARAISWRDKVLGKYFWLPDCVSPLRAAIAETAAELVQLVNESISSSPACGSPRLNFADLES
jgi:hypothetical protein